MRTFLCFLWLIIFPTLFADSLIQERRNLSETIKLLRNLGPKQCLKEVEIAPFNRFTSLPKKEISQALKITYTSIFELFKNKTIHWNNDDFQTLMEHLNRHAKSNSVPVMSSELETLVKNFKLLDGFLTQQNSSRCAWEIGRNEIMFVLNHFRKTLLRKTHI